MNDFTLVGGPTAVFEYAALRWLTDPAFSPPGEYEGGLVKLTGPAIAPDAVGAVDVVLLSHDHHADNLDPAGRAFLPRAGRVLTTAAGAERLGGNATGLEPWSSVQAESGARQAVTITAVPVQHGPVGTTTSPGCDRIRARLGRRLLHVSRQRAGTWCAASRSLSGRSDVAVRSPALQCPALDGGNLTPPATSRRSPRFGRASSPVHRGLAALHPGCRGSPGAAFAGNGVSDRLRVPSAANARARPRRRRDQISSWTPMEPPPPG
jgi:hypothetical protein